ncbi:Fis family transcriptional regulator [Bradyrhizobium lablabi]|uniref:Fis family transcriptional regulator n=1 Tax=Bradyrhizobium lablabi TaxID=722472 RepID=A0A0R3MUX8_9BRAD|nr:GAF domain-containing protein [Bradyrhizobium lablabi]KRR21475.1 Fis family transcriptional regulator [Bradyrhizobium lablabi]
MPVDGSARHAERIQSAISSNGAAKSALIASWQRSACFHKLDPARRNPPERLTDPEFRRARQGLEVLIQVAQPSLDRLHHSVGGAGCCVLLADRNGVPVERRGAPGDDATFFDWGLWPGAIWSEESEGTNGIGTCLVEQRALTIHCDQHFYARNALLSCTTAPLYDHEGRLVAALDVSSCKAGLIENFVNLIANAVIDAAARIEAECFRQAYPDARILIVPVPDKMGKALIAVDQDDLVVGATRAARQALGISRACLQKSLPAAEVMNMSRTVTENLAAAERGVLQRALARAEGNVTAAAEALGMSRATLYRKLRRLDLHRAH